jgi:3-methyladenine DNA glycosylase AlkD
MTEAKGQKTEDTGLRPEALAAEIRSAIAALPSRTGVVRALRREYSRRLKAAPGRAVVQTALRLMEGPSFTERFVAYELVLFHPAALASLGQRDLQRFGRGLDGWESVDTFACYLAGPAWREGQVPDALIEGWARSRDRWWRRAALVSTVPLNNRARGARVERSDAARTLAICQLLVADRDDMVIKAMSWALRELARRDPAAVREFVQAHSAALAPRVRREVDNKLRTGLKNPRNRTGQRRALPGPVSRDQNSARSE